MKIFISHKMPADAEAVKEFASRLTLYAGNEIKISHAGLFDRGGDISDDIEREILSSDVFTLFHTSETYDWSYCILECGIFKGTSRVIQDGS